MDYDHATKSQDKVPQRHERLGIQNIYENLENENVSIKIHARDRNLAIINLLESENITFRARRLANLNDVTVRAGDADMIYLIKHENLLNNAVYHAACLTTCLAYRPNYTKRSFCRIGKKSVCNLLRTKLSHFYNLVALENGDVDSAVDDARVFVTVLYDLKYKFNKLQNNLNLLTQQLAIYEDKSVIKLPPCELVFKQHVLHLYVHYGKAKCGCGQMLPTGIMARHVSLVRKFSKMTSKSQFSLKDKWHQTLYKILFVRVRGKACAGSMR
ncbi:unnamed protein product [Mytilus coruscus]|uniref:Uncharacterized protein n=1 Tax=Mytilus coruscus TaxID=42192 RepID=A0A6J8BRZ0_MYTCO|nr:unnamed protein product [Mytilus coruscus]